MHLWLQQHLNWNLPDTSTLPLFLVTGNHPQEASIPGSLAKEVPTFLSSFLSF